MASTCVVVSHNGLGDNLFMIGALRFLCNYYNKIYFLCKNKYYKDVSLFFDTDNIICISFDENNERNDILNIINNKYNTNDILVCGPYHKTYLKNKITNELFLNYKTIEKGYTINYDSINSVDYSFIEGFYKDIHLNLTQFYDYFELPSTNESISYYNDIKEYYIIFIQLLCSEGIKLNITNLLQKYLNDEKVILITNTDNLYDINNNSDHIKKKYNICKKILYNSRIINYKDIIINSDEIYIIASSFTGIVLPYLKTNRLKANTVKIIDRYLAKNIVI